MSEKNEKVCTVLINLEQFLIFVSATSGCFNFYVCFISVVTVGIKNFSVGLKICALTARI